MTHFTTTRLSGNRVLVRGTDVTGATGEQVLASSQWDGVHVSTELSEAHAAFDETVREFFAPLTEAADALNEAHSVDVDPNTYIVLEEPEEGTAASAGKVVELSYDSQILRILESGDHDRLIWVQQKLEILAPDTEVDATPAPADEHVPGKGFFGR